MPHAQTSDSALKLNQIQVIGTQITATTPALRPNESKLWQAKYADAYKGLDYQHLTVAAAVRQRGTAD